MSDFAQTGLITTLQRLNESHLGVLEEQLAAVAREKRIALVLPCHGRDLGSPALAHIVEELAGAAWLGDVVLSMNGLDHALYSRAESLAATMPQRVQLLWNDRESALGAGKGANVAAAFRFLATQGGIDYVATQDCDVSSFRRHDLARLFYPLAKLEYRYAKAYYPRVTDRLYGRVTRLFLAPLLHACVRVAGHQPLLDFLLSFRYPLSGEVAMAMEVASALPVARGYALEIGQLCEVFRHVEPRDVCQVGGGPDYDHRHQPAATSLAAMAGEIAGELFHQLAAEGMPDTVAFREAIRAAYRKESATALRRSAALAQINALPFDETAEREAVEIFAGRIG